MYIYIYIYIYIFIDVEFDSTYQGTLHGIIYRNVCKKVIFQQVVVGPLLSHYISRKLSESNGITHYILLNLSAAFYTLTIISL